MRLLRGAYRGRFVGDHGIFFQLRTTSLSPASGPQDQMESSEAPLFQESQ
ncbi:MAG: hypothetical protein ONB44_00410 [candidate division KSB1 bacterium]|nr:hypothetical protein [candidate division KSB1 bacterium]MDZ7300583.1 hypothetical protein [candidate division KSB1 bacterium]MDZ7309720.1 hypothetical protein [candidate division KSB1 bacterium]